ncbi:MAG: TraR/DksA family transcriptional regulator [Bacteroidetes bacterium]|nr:TraR/DksA family transcriptional regulator [Bacteroidota bacterium]MBS1633930.1 TraR/DksA family transcriptional regulator [Bacteroidota bacterium]
MATKKHTHPSGGKTAPKKVAKSAKKAAPKKPAAKKPMKSSTPKKAINKKVVKPVTHKATPKKNVAKPVSAKAAKPVHPVKPAHPVKPSHPVKPVVEAAKPVKKTGAFDPKSLVSIKPKVKPIIKKEPPKPAKIVIPKITTKSSVKYEPEFTKSVLDSPLQQYQTTPTQRYSDADLTEFREIILKKLDAAKKELAYLQGLITRKDEGGDMDEARYMTMEDGSVSMEREQLSQMASRQITFIDHLEKALMRIENKTYGICRVTGKLIDKARLRAVPHATLSIEAKQMMSK